MAIILVKDMLKALCRKYNAKSMLSGFSAPFCEISYCNLMAVGI